MTKMVFVGEAWGEQELSLQSPFVGPAGQELSRMLAQAGYPCKLLSYNFNSATRMLHYWSKFPHILLNVFNTRPPENNVEFFYAKPNTCEVSSLLPSRRIDNAIHQLKAEYEFHVIQLHETLKELKPNIIVALGNTALWALGLPPSISKLRGNVVETPFGKVLPTFHPASILRNWSQRIVAVLDLHKALRESEYPEIRIMSREIWTKPTIADLYRWWDLYGSQAEILAFDIETVANKQISEISFASDSTHALHVPFFWKENKKFVNWWPDAKSEFAAWKFVKMVLESNVPKICQNGIQYDSYWLAKEVKIGVKNIQHCTMQMSHAWALELEKSLGFLGSIFLDELSWKHIRTETNKQDD